MYYSEVMLLGKGINRNGFKATEIIQVRFNGDGLKRQVWLKAVRGNQNLDICEGTAKRIF